VRRVFRRRLMLPLALFAVASVSTGCGTFADSDAVARVDEVSLSQDDFEATLTELGASASEPLDAELVRGQITSWITGQLADQPIDDAAVRASYDAGYDTNGVLCLSVIVVEDEATADTVAAELDGGRPFDETFAESNIDQAQTETGGHLECVPRDVVDAAPEQPFIQASVVLDAADPVGTAPLLNTDGDEVGWVVVVFRSFDELADEDIAIVAAAQGSTADVYVDPRYGTFDGSTGQVIGLG